MSFEKCKVKVQCKKEEAFSHKISEHVREMQGCHFDFTLHEVTLI